jgi:hypothetical protein
VHNLVLVSPYYKVGQVVPHVIVAVFPKFGLIHVLKQVFTDKKYSAIQVKQVVPVVPGVLPINKNNLFKFYSNLFIEIYI